MEVKDIFTECSRPFSLVLERFPTETEQTFNAEHQNKRFGRCCNEKLEKVRLLFMHKNEFDLQSSDIESHLKIAPTDAMLWRTQTVRKVSQFSGH